MFFRSQRGFTCRQLLTRRGRHLDAKHLIKLSQVGGCEAQPSSLQSPLQPLLIKKRGGNAGAKRPREMRTAFRPVHAPSGERPTPGPQQVDVNAEMEEPCRALCACCKAPITWLPDRGVQYTPICYTQRLEDIGTIRSVGSKGDSYDNAAAEAVNSLYKKELINLEGPWQDAGHVTVETAEWVS
jgi:hypothetical protein